MKEGLLDGALLDDFCSPWSTASACENVAESLEVGVDLSKGS